MKIKLDEITIRLRGTKQFRQYYVDKIYELLNSDDMDEELNQDGNGIDFSSSLEPSDEVM